MKAMLLAAGLGTRMRPLTDKLPKPLLPLGETTLIERHLSRLALAGFSEVVINLYHLGSQIRDLIGDGSRLGIPVVYSEEDSLLETGGGIRKALPLLGESPFAVISADVYIDYDFGALLKPLPHDALGRLVMVPNPPHHPDGDFAIDADGYLRSGSPTKQGSCRTWSSVGVFHPELVSSESDEYFPLRRVFDQAISESRLTAEVYDGYWCDVGTPARYNQLLADLELSRGTRERQ